LNGEPKVPTKIARQHFGGNRYFLALDVETLWFSIFLDVDNFGIGERVKKELTALAQVLRMDRGLNLIVMGQHIPAGTPRLRFRETHSASEC
jgi:hypothetical protein